MYLSYVLSKHHYMKSKIERVYISLTSYYFVMNSYTLMYLLSILLFLIYFINYQYKIKLIFLKFLITACKLFYRCTFFAVVVAFFLCCHYLLSFFEKLANLGSNTLNQFRLGDFKFMSFRKIGPRFSWNFCPGGNSERKSETSRAVSHDHNI